jgi:hypothetical protein
MATLTLQPDGAAGIDTHVRQNSANTNYATYQYEEACGYTGSKEHAFFKFDLSSLSGVTISDATLYLYGVGGGNSNTLNIYRVLAASGGWTEANATWNYAVASSTRWAGDTGNDGGADAGGGVSGTDHSGTLMGTASFSATAGAETSFALNVTEFAAMVAANYGIIVKSGVTSYTVMQMASSDNATAARRPKLVVDYTPAVTFRPWYAPRARLIGSM